MDSLAIPEFLRREAPPPLQGPPAPRVPAAVYMPAPPDPREEFVSWSTARRFRVHFGDEAPTIGSGVRYVWAVVGWKRVRLFAGWYDRATITRATWNRLRKEQVKAPTT